MRPFLIPPPLGQPHSVFGGTHYFELNAFEIHVLYNLWSNILFTWSGKLHIKMKHFILCVGGIFSWSYPYFFPFCFHIVAVVCFCYLGELSLWITRCLLCMHTTDSLGVDDMSKCSPVQEIFFILPHFQYEVCWSKNKSSPVQEIPFLYFATLSIIRHVDLRIITSPGNLLIHFPPLCTISCVQLRINDHPSIAQI